MSSTIHSMKLNDPWYEYVRSGYKTYEGRRATEKVKSIKPGDKIEFKHHIYDSLPAITVNVLEVIRFPTFNDALNALPIYNVLPIPNITISEGVEIYKKYVSIETQINDGIYMIKISI